ncbi:MAG: single-stranded DNA-binding protein [Treponema succinifaciens]|uniref:single-stranded DNA-binding protein n=1 Tax=Treponema succinifaciens TaxID=167 RepID=UPI002A74AB3C|nr:single-stranded DNA-binding protein [Treponema succinifaciens]MDY2615385.1 single-stranded DNA-binding protein [Treponema succinifaciens]
MNKIIIKGRLAKDPELKKTNSGKVLCNFSVAVGRNFDYEITDFFDCTAWNNNAEFISKYFSKGKEILIDGEMQSDKFKDKNGNNRTSWKVNVNRAEFCGSKGENENTPSNNNSAADIDDLDDLDDDLPFE